jgi:hypothetical protein
MSEKKKALPQLNSEMHTILPLPIEMVDERLYSLNKDGYSTRIERSSVDLAYFFVQSPISDKVKAEGRFLRWNGTFTRVDVQPKSPLMQIRLRYWLPALGLIFAIYQAVYIWNNPVGPGACVAFPMFLFIAGILSIPVLFGSIRAFFGLSSSDFKNRQTIDRMMQAIADTLTKDTDGALEFDGSPLTLEMLLSEEKYKHFRLGEDGEIEAKA